MQVLELLSHIAVQLFDRLGTHLISQLGLHSLGSLVQKVPRKFVFRICACSWANLLLVEKTNVNKAAFSQESDMETICYQFV